MERAVEFESLCRVLGSGRPQRQLAFCFRVSWLVEWVNVKEPMLDDHKVLGLMTGLFY